MKSEPEPEPASSSTGWGEEATGTPESSKRDTKPVSTDKEVLQVLKQSRSSLPVGPHSDFLQIEPGRVLEGKYKLVEEIGRGSMGVVFLAEDITLQRKVAVKFLMFELCTSDDSAERFRREAVAMAAINDHNVAKIYTYGEMSGKPYFVMEHLDGKTLQDIIDEQKSIGRYIQQRDALGMLWQLLGGLGEIHRSGAVHRDIKPANVMLSGTPSRATILDFGLVRDVRVKDDTVQLAGTPAYIAPELVEGKPGADCSPLVDIYSVGASAYEIFTGTIPFNGDTWSEILLKHVTEKAIPPSHRRPELSPQLDSIILRAMSKNPTDRFQSCEDFLRELMILEDDLSTESRPSSWPSVRRPGTITSRGSSSPRGSKDSGGVSKRLFVVDSDPEFRGMIKGAAKVAVSGCDVRVGKDVESLEELDAFAPKVVILDFSTPEVNGAEMAAAVRANPKHSETEIVAVFQEGDAFERELLEFIGVSTFIYKPVEIDQLVELLIGVFC